MPASPASLSLAACLDATPTDLHENILRSTITSLSDNQAVFLAKLNVPANPGTISVLVQFSDRAPSIADQCFQDCFPKTFTIIPGSPKDNWKARGAVQDFQARQQAESGFRHALGRAKY